MLKTKITDRRWLWVLIPLSIVLFAIIFSGAILRTLGGLIVVDDTLLRSDVVVVLNTGVEYYPRLVQAAEIYLAKYVCRLAGHRDGSSQKRSLRPE